MSGRAIHRELDASRSAEWDNSIGIQYLEPLAGSTSARVPGSKHLKASQDYPKEYGVQVAKTWCKTVANGSFNPQSDDESISDTEYTSTVITETSLVILFRVYSCIKDMSVSNTMVDSVRFNVITDPLRI